jgi:hypothetical protein
VQHIAVAFRQGQVPARRFPGFDQLIGVHHKGLAIGRQARAGAVAHKQRATELAFKFLHACGDRGLGDMKLLGRRGEAAVADDFQKGAGEINVHGAADGEGAAIVGLHLTGGESALKTQNTNSQTLPRIPESR